MSNQNSLRRIAHMLHKIREETINKKREKLTPYRLHTRAVFELPDGRGAVKVNGAVYASKELIRQIGDTVSVRVSNRTGEGGAAFDVFKRPFCDLERVPATSLRGQ